MTENTSSISRLNSIIRWLSITLWPMIPVWRKYAALGIRVKATCALVSIEKAFGHNETQVPDGNPKCIYTPQQGKDHSVSFDIISSIFKLRS